MRQSAHLAAGGLRRCMQRTHPGLFEFQLAADFGAAAPSCPRLNLAGKTQVWQFGWGWGERALIRCHRVGLPTPPGAAVRVHCCEGGGGSGDQEHGVGFISQLATKSCTDHT